MELINPVPQSSIRLTRPRRYRERSSVQNVLVLGATGSIGTATIDVIRHLNQVDPAFSLAALGGFGTRKCCEIARNLAIKWRAGTSRDSCRLLFSDEPLGRSELAESIGAGTEPTATHGIDFGPEALVRAAQAEEVDTVVAAIVGRAGLESTSGGCRIGKRVALANKETLVVAGPLVRSAIASSRAELLPVDSEHSAIFQCIQGAAAPPKKLILTASGGPFRTWTSQQMAEASPDSAIAHPTWDMGPKITVDSATMMNKALEVIEARWLFDLPAERDRGGCTPPIDHPFDGRIRGWLGARPAQSPRHATADPVRIDLSATLPCETPSRWTATGTGS